MMRGKEGRTLCCTVHCKPEEVSAATEALGGIRGNVAALFRQQGASRKNVFKIIEVVSLF